MFLEMAFLHEPPRKQLMMPTDPGSGL